MVGRRLRQPGTLVICDEHGQQWVHGRDQPTTLLNADGYELLRGAFSRRSQSQMVAWNWSPAPPRLLRRFGLFGPRHDDQPIPLTRSTSPGTRVRESPLSATVDPRWGSLRVGDVILDYGGKHETFVVEKVTPGSGVVYSTQRGRSRGSWSITLTEVGEPGDLAATRVFLRLRMGPIKHVRLFFALGELMDASTVAVMAAGLRERLVTPR